MNTQVRQSWQSFFIKAGLEGNLPRVVAGGSRTATIELFRGALSSGMDKYVPLLLVDSEMDVPNGQSALTHLFGSNPPSNAQEDQCFLMIQIMETWFLADVVALKNCFGSNFKAHAIKNWTNLEGVPKATVLQALSAATGACKKIYAKGKVSFEVLGAVDPQQVEAKCASAARFLGRLRGL